MLEWELISDSAKRIKSKPNRQIQCAVLLELPNFMNLFFNFGRHESFFWGHWCPCFGLLVISPLGLKKEWAALFTLGRGTYTTHFLRFTSGSTPAYLLVSSMAAKPISFTYLWPDIGGTQTSDILLHSQKLYWLSYAGSALISWTYLRDVTY